MDHPLIWNAMKVMISNGPIMTDRARFRGTKRVGGTGLFLVVRPFLSVGICWAAEGDSVSDGRPATLGHVDRAKRCTPRQHNARRRSARLAFTLVELLVVVAIIGILVALLLPAVQAAREAVRRASCANNLVQLVMAVHQYEATHHVYPPGTINATGPIMNRLRGYHHGWVEQVLPFMEAEAIFHHIDRDVSVYHRRNMPVRKLGLSWASCPSSPQPGKSYTNYAALHHDVEASIDTGQNGVFFLNSAVRHDDVSDGINYTIFLGEKIAEPGDLGWLSGTRAILRNTGERINTSSDQSRAVWRTIPTEPPGVVDGLAGSGRMDSGGMMSDQPASLGGGADAAEGVLLNEDIGMYSGQVDDGSAILAGTTPRLIATFVGGFGSFHNGGANFAMGDGSVRLLSETISKSVYQQLGHRADGELVNLP